MFLLNLLRIFVGVAVVAFTYWIMKRRKRMTTLERLGYPVVPGVSFISGNLKKLPKGKSYMDTQMEWMDEYSLKTGPYGRIVGFYFGPRPCVYVSDPDILKDVLIKEFPTFINRPIIADGRHNRFFDVLHAKDANWKRSRTILSPTFSSAKMKLMSQIAHRSVDIFMEVVAGKCKNNSDCDVHEVYQALTLDVIGEIVLAMKVDCQRDQNDPFLKLTRQIFKDEKNSITFLALCFPEISELLSIFQSKTMLGMSCETIRVYLQHIIGERRKNPKDAPQDLLQFMIEARANTKNTDWKHQTLTNAEVMGNALMFLLAGYDTTSTALTYISYVLAQHPEVQDKCYEEIKAHVTDESGLTYDTILSLPYVDQVVHEGLRVYPPIAIHFGREVAEDCEIRGWKFTKGMQVFVPIWHVHHDPDIWPDPWKFDPDRWSVENRKNIPSMAFMPFGDGPRQCVGKRFAIMEVKMALTNLLLKYRLRVSDNTPKTLKFNSTGFGLTPMQGKILINFDSREKQTVSA